MFILSLVRVSSPTFFLLVSRLRESEPPGSPKTTPTYLVFRRRRRSVSRRRRRGRSLPCNMWARRKSVEMVQGFGGRVNQLASSRLRSVALSYPEDPAHLLGRGEPKVLRQEPQLAVKSGSSQQIFVSSRCARMT